MRSWAVIALVLIFVTNARAESQVRTFVTQNFETGIPFDQAAALGSGAVPELLAMLEDAQLEPYWSNIVYTLGAIGDASAVQPLEEFLRTHQGQISWNTFTALQGVPTALGFIGERGNTQALDLLAALADDTYWQQARFAVFDNVSVNDAVVRKSMMKSTIVALGYTGKKEAKGTLESLRARPQVMAEFGADINSAISQ